MEMVVDDINRYDLSTRVFALGKTAWKVGITLSNLDDNIETNGFAVTDLTEDVKSLGNVCDVAYARLEDVRKRNDARSILPAELIHRIWACFAAQVDATSHAIEELNQFVRFVRGENTETIGQAQCTRRLEKSSKQLPDPRTNIGRHAESLSVALQLIITINAHFSHHKAQGHLLGDLSKLQKMVDSIRISMRQTKLSQTNDSLLECAHEVIQRGTVMYEAGFAADSNAEILQETHNIASTRSWIDILKVIRSDQHNIIPPDDYFDSNSPELKTSVTQQMNHGSQDDLQVDLAKSALETGTKAFDAGEWEEAASLLEEAVLVLEQLAPQQRKFCDLFTLHYQLYVCSYHTREPQHAKEALLDLVKQPTSTDKQRECILDATHLLAQIFMRNGDLNSARSQCESALQGRRKLLGKHSDAAFESLALMAHIYVLLNKRALAKSCLAMIPEKRREAVLAAVEVSLGPGIEHLDFSSLLTPQAQLDSPRPETVRQSICSDASGSTAGLGLDRTIFDYGSAIKPSSTASPQSVTRTLASTDSSGQNLHSHMAVSSSFRNVREAKLMGKERPADQSLSVSPQEGSVARIGRLPSQASAAYKTSPASRKAIYEKMGCQPRDRIEEAVCSGDYAALINLLAKKKSFWRSGLRKRVRPERVTALHFAALFGEIDMARRLLDANYNVNEVPFGYSTSLTPLNFAVGARQADMVRFLIENGAKPAESESWSALAAQLLSRSWLAKTLLDDEKELLSTRIIATMSVLLQYQWDIREPIDASRSTVLHRAVSFWTGEYKLDLDVRTNITLFMCERGANPFQQDAAGKTPYDLAQASGHQNLISILEQAPMMGLYTSDMEPVELPEHPL
ncbi:hypothetical protein BKA63DRAFT_56665 [Paraphoma chrysanthemicola]|nr:hypothetical protein BKA63DRAFT_56665 [Paraphoma chrysanthemicola]